MMNYNIQDILKLLNNILNGKLFPLTRQEAIEAMKSGENLVDGLESYSHAHYHWYFYPELNKGNYLSSDSYEDLAGEGVVIFEHKLPHLFRMGEENTKTNKIHEAVLFAADKHGKDLRKGTEIPYISHPIEVMLILMANGCSEEVIIAGVLHDTLEDTKTDANEILDKFGKGVLEIVKSESENKSNTWKVRKQATIDLLKTASLETKLVCCADKLTNIYSMVRDKKNVGEKLWERFNASKDDIEWYYRSIYNSLSDLKGYPMYGELSSAVLDFGGDYIFS